MDLLIEDNEQEAFASLYDDRPAGLGVFTAAGSIPLTVTRVKRLNGQQEYDSKVLEPQRLTSWTLRAALGGGLNLPVAGSWPITFTDSLSAAHSSDWIIPYNPTSDDIQNTLNNLTAVSDIGGVSVQGDDGFFEITFNSVGARNLLTGNPARLVPLSLLTFARAVTGDGSTQEVQTLRILQNAGAMVSLTSDSNGTDINQTDVVVGDATHNAQIRITMPENRYGGTWTFTKSGTVVNGLGWSDNSAEIQAALQAALGSGTVLVDQDTADTYVFTFAGSLGLRAITIVLDGSTLLVPDTQSGELDLTGAGVDLLFGDKDSVIAKFEIEATPPGGPLRKIFQADVPLRRAVVSAASVAPSGIQTMADYTGTEEDSSVSTGQTITLSPAKRFLQWFKLIALGAGSGTYTVNVVLNRTKAETGAIFRIELDFAASANPTVNIKDSNGDIIDTIPGDASQATYYLFEGQLRGGVWKKLSGQFQ